MDYRHLIPKKGVRVPDPATRRPLPEEGALKPLNTYWHRRLAAGDVSIKESKNTEQSAAGPSGGKNSGEAPRASSGKGSK